MDASEVVVGDAVEIHSLKFDSQFNGQLGKIVGRQRVQGEEQFLVALSAVPTPRALRPSNLRKHSGGTPREVSSQRGAHFAAGSGEVPRPLQPPGGEVHAAAPPAASPFVPASAPGSVLPGAEHQTAEAGSAE
eukprot:Hpha_TRINITY_DN18130_c0_g1::TRINITY_DN18130_c0_g1_i1::g.84657::m.84657